tara:strand:+ start:93 stop:476 length:384 start_codon:yes stop_codon:yes gene_type:complete
MPKKTDLPPTFSGVCMVIIRVDHCGYHAGDVIDVMPADVDLSTLVTENPDWSVVYVDKMTMKQAEKYTQPLRQIDRRTKIFRRAVGFDEAKLKLEDFTKIKDKTKFEKLDKVKEVPPTIQPDRVRIT